MSKLALMGYLTPQQTKNLSRGLFKDMITELSKIRDTYEGGAFNTKNPLKYKQTKERFSALEDVLKKRNADPTEFVSDAIRTGTLGNKKLSSQERRELANRLAILNMYKTGDSPELASVASNPMFRNDIRPSHLLGYTEEYMAKRGSLYDKFNRANSLLNEKNNSGGIVSPQNLQAIKNISDEATRNFDAFTDSKYYYRPPDMPITNSFQLDNIIDRTGFGMKGESGRGRNWENFRRNEAIEKKFQSTNLFNDIIKKYNITDKNEAEIIYKLLPEWEGTVAELVNVARMI